MLCLKLKYIVSLTISLGIVLLLDSYGYFQLHAIPTKFEIETDSFIVLGFGLGDDTDTKLPQPGQSNIDIAKRLLELNPEKKKTVMQRGIYTALLTLEQDKNSLDDWVIQLPHASQAYANTHTAIFQSWALLESEGLQIPVIITHKDQSQRAYLIARKIYPNIIIPNNLPNSYDPKSTQFWCRSKLSYVFAEYFLNRPIGYVLQWY